MLIWKVNAALQHFALMYLICWFNWFANYRTSLSSCICCTLKLIGETILWLKKTGCNREWAASFALLKPLGISQSMGWRAVPAPSSHIWEDTCFDGCCSPHKVRALHFTGLAGWELGVSGCWPRACWEICVSSRHECFMRNHWPEPKVQQMLPAQSCTVHPSSRAVSKQVSAKGKCLFASFLDSAYILQYLPPTKTASVSCSAKQIAPLPWLINDWIICKLG